MIELGQKRKVCANCGNSYRENEKYCRYCGAPMGTPDYIEEEFACIYGPWKTTLMIDDEKFCPECGGPAPVVASEE